MNAICIIQDITQISEQKTNMNLKINCLQLGYPNNSAARIFRYYGTGRSFVHNTDEYPKSAKIIMNLKLDFAREIPKQLHFEFTLSVKTLKFRKSFGIIQM